MTPSRACLALLPFALALPGFGPAAAQDATPEATPAAGGRIFALPGEQVFPEGVAYQEATGDFFVGSTTDGTLYRGNVETGDVEVFVTGVAGAAAVGMKLDGQGRLYVASGQTGFVTVHDTATGDLLAVFDNGLGPNTFLNDVAIAPSGDVYVTDSFNPFVFRIPAGALAGAPASPVAGTPVAARGALEVGVDLNGTAFAFGEGFNANGIVVTPDGANLVVAQTNTGTLYRIELASGAVTPIDLGGENLPGDGMLLDGQTLYVVSEGQIAVVELGADYATGTVVGRFGDPSFATPTTIARYDGCLLVVNSQFANQGAPALPFTVSAVPIPDWALAVAAATPVAAATAGVC